SVGNQTYKPLVLQGRGGNVGIGTTTPTQKLDVEGNIRATDVCTTAGKCLSALSAEFSQTAGDYELNLNSAERTTASATYVKLKETKIGVGGTLRIKFSIKGIGGPLYGRIYRNGVAVGTERNTSSDTYVEFSEDIGGWSAGDLVQVYAHRTGSLTSVDIQGLNIYTAAPPIAGGHVSY
ncbi:MAG: hypothetical protein AAB496_01755, partial [Patescibacteria group bacterium]